MIKRENCVVCDDWTERAGKADDSLYAGGAGPFCERCFTIAKEAERYRWLRDSDVDVRVVEDSVVDVTFWSNTRGTFVTQRGITLDAAIDSVRKETPDDK